MYFQDNILIHAKDQEEHDKLLITHSSCTSQGKRSYSPAGQIQIRVLALFWPRRISYFLFRGCNIRMHLDINKPDLRTQVQHHHFRQTESRANTKDQQLLVGQKVLARNYRGGDKWVPAVVQSQTGPLSYTVLTNSGLPWRRHIDQLLDLSEDGTPLSAAPTEVDLSPFYLWPTPPISCRWSWVTHL